VPKRRLVGTFVSEKRYKELLKLKKEGRFETMSQLVRFALEVAFCYFDMDEGFDKEK